MIEAFLKFAWIWFVTFTCILSLFVVLKMAPVLKALEAGWRP